MIRDLLGPAIELALLVYCLIDCIQTPEAAVRNIPRWGWIILIIILPIIGGIAWLVAGRPQRSGAGGRPRDRWPSGPVAGFPEARRPPRGPDDDSEFLHGLQRADEEHEDVLKKWEADLRRREEQLRGDSPSSEDPPPAP